MEVIRGSPHVVFPMDDASRVGEARRHAVAVAQRAGFGETAAGKLALVVTELGSNLFKHAQRGRLLIGARYRDARCEIEVLSLDEGPGIRDVAKCMSDGFSTAGTRGTGLGAVSRLADAFDLHSSVPAGTVAVARVRGGADPSPARPEALFRLGVVALAAPGESVSGDGWIAVLEHERAALLMADGLGHGPGAEEAAVAAIQCFERQPFAEPCAALEGVHAALRMTRGAAVLNVLLDRAASTIRYAGAGNVAMRVISGLSDRTLLSQNGTAGVQVRRPEEVHAEWPSHAAVILHTDGIQMRWQAQVVAPLLGRDPSLMACVVARDFCRGRDDATVMVVRRKE